MGWEIDFKVHGGISDDIIHAVGDISGSNAGVAMSRDGLRI